MRDAGRRGLEETSGPAALIVSDREPAAWVAAIEDARARRAELAARGVAHAASFRWGPVAAATRAVLLEAAG